MRPRSWWTPAATIATTCSGTWRGWTSRRWTWSSVTHPHADHIGQFDKVLGAVEVAEAWWSGATHTTQTFERAVAALEASDAAYEEPRAADATAIGPLEFEFVNPA